MNKNKRSIELSNELLDSIDMAMNDQSFEAEYYLDIVKNEVTFLSDFLEEDIYEEISEQLENDSDGRFRDIPHRFSREGWRQMERFIMSLDDIDEKTRDLLMITIQGRGAFRRFDDAVFELGIREQWFEFRDRENRKEILDWLLSCDLISDADVEKGMQLLEDRIAKNKQREEDQANMKKGARVRCRDNAGHNGQVTVGDIYDVLDDRDMQIEIRIKDDRGKIIWIPKSHFELVK